jgi:glucose-fructose oxidoreductase
MEKTMATTDLTRRGFWKTTAGAVAFPYVITTAALGNGKKASASERVTLGHIGVGGQGSFLFGQFQQLKGAQSVACADAYKDRRERRASQCGGKAYADFREVLARDDIDAVVVATPDHWHVPIALAAVRAGKDVYVEKPLGISIEHDKALRQAVHLNGRVFQYGTQQRSFNPQCGFACELLLNGHLGELKAVQVTAPNGSTGGQAVAQPVPEGLDYELWLGPAPFQPFTQDRVLGLGRWFIYDYALGFIAGWGAHPLDIAHCGYPHIPIEYTGTGRIPTDGLFDTIVDWDIRGRYASGVEFTLKAGSDETRFVGSQGWVAASRGGITAEPDSLLKIKIKPDAVRLPHDSDHYRDFISCVRTRKTPVSNIDSAAQSDFMSHLGDIAIRTGRTIRWDPATETIAGDEAAARMTRRALRAPWSL